MSTIDEIMVQAVRYADAAIRDADWRSDKSDTDDWAAERDNLRNMITAALADARREVAEAMREAAAVAVQDVAIPGYIESASERIRALPLPDAPAKPVAVLLTDEQIAAMIARYFGPVAIASKSATDFACAIESAVLAANGLGVSK